MHTARRHRRAQHASLAGAFRAGARRRRRSVCGAARRRRGSPRSNPPQAKLCALTGAPQATLSRPSPPQLATARCKPAGETHLLARRR